VLVAEPVEQSDLDRVERVEVGVAQPQHLGEVGVVRRAAPVAPRDAAARTGRRVVLLDDPREHGVADLGWASWA
jgi:hypothetical protein